MDKAELLYLLSKGDSNWTGCNFTIGLKIIDKYTDMDETNITGVGHEIIYSISIDRAMELNFTKTDIIKLSSLNWMCREDSLACFI